MANNLTPGTPTPQSGIYTRSDGMQVAVSQGYRLPAGRPGSHGQNYGRVLVSGR